ncbi:unnamed protein product [Euphydryas editha]|uniref:Uncharacterized protein n=1 Tax=Euphydryas editha TaxID=104508 RepID=A0AAU9UQP9_EUPED|nr:unnamed protein product [Euphydryas editha]
MIKMLKRNDTIAIRNVDNGKVVGEKFDSKSYDRKFITKEEVRNVELDKYERDSLLSCDRTDSQCRDGFSNSVVKNERNKFKNESSGIDKAVLKVKSEILGTYNDNARWSENFNKGINKSNVNNDTCSTNSQKAQLVDDNDNLINRISKLNIDPNKENKNLLDQNSVKVNKNTSKSFKMFNNNINIHNNMSYNSASKSTFDDKGVFKSDDDIYENNNLCDNIVIESKVGDVIDENGSKIETALKPKHATDEEDRKNNNDTENNLDFNYIGNTINSNNIDKYDSNVKKVFSKILARKTFKDQNTDTSKYYKNNNEYKIFDKQKQLPHDNYSIDNTKGSIILSNKNLDSLDSDVDIDASNNNIVLEDNFNKINKNLNVFDAKSSKRSSLLQTKLAIYKRVHLK